MNQPSIENYPGTIEIETRLCLNSRKFITVMKVAGQKAQEDECEVSNVGPVMTVKARFTYRGGRLVPCTEE